MPTPACTTCNKRRTGRYTRKRGDVIQRFHCYVCLPQGKGMDETPAPPAEKALPTPRVNAEAAKEEGLALVGEMRESIEGLEIQTAEDYEAADTLLSKISKARRNWKDRMEKVIRPMRQALDGLYELNRDVDRPLEGMEKQLRRGMADYKLEEARQRQAAEDERLRLEEQKRQEAEERRLQAERAKTPQMRGRLQNLANQAEAEADTLAVQETPAPVQGEHTTTRPVKKVRVVDVAAFYKGIGDGYIPQEAAEVRLPVLNRLLKEDPDTVVAFPGVEVYDDIEIVRR